MNISRKKLVIVASICLVITVFRLILPYFIKNFVNETLRELDGYHGYIKDVDLHLFRGGYVIKKLVIEKKEGDIHVPFVDISEIDLSIHWKALLHGKIAGEVIVHHPQINFAVDSTGEITQTGQEHNWAATIAKLTPLKIQLNLFEIHNGSVRYIDFSKVPNVRIALDSISGKAENLSNALDYSEKLPSPFHLSAQVHGGGYVQVDARVNILKELPDFDLNFELKDLELKSLKEFTEAYAHFDFDDGTLSVYSEILMEDAAYSGYVKPVFSNLKILERSSDQENGFWRNLWEGILAVSTTGIENQPKKSAASKIPFEGSVKGSDIKVWSAIASTLKNAFIEALPARLDHSVGEAPVE